MSRLADTIRQYPKTSKVVAVGAGLALAASIAGTPKSYPGHHNRYIAHSGWHVAMDPTLLLTDTTRGRDILADVHIISPADAAEPVVAQPHRILASPSQMNTVARRIRRKSQAGYPVHCFSGPDAKYVQYRRPLDQAEAGDPTAEICLETDYTETSRKLGKTIIVMGLRLDPAYTAKPFASLQETFAAMSPQTCNLVVSPLKLYAQELIHDIGGLSSAELAPIQLNVAGTGEAACKPLPALHHATHAPTHTS